MRTQHLCALALVGLMAAGCALGRAETETKRIAVLKFKGSKATDLQHLVADLVAKHHEVVSYKKYRTTARRLGARKMRARHVARVAAKLGVDAVVEGKLIRRGKRKYTLRIQVREGSTGKTVEEYTIPVRRREMSDSNRRTLERKLVGLIDELEPIDRYGDGDEDDELDEDDRGDRRRARRSSRSSAKRKARLAAKRKAERDERRRERQRAERKERRRDRLRADREERRRADREDDYRDERRASRRARRDRKTRRRARRSDPIDRIDEELEENPVVLNNEVDENGQFVDDEVPDALK